MLASAQKEKRFSSTDLGRKLPSPATLPRPFYLSLTMRREIEAISPLVARLISLNRASHCVSGDDSDIEVALREALANVVQRTIDSNPGRGKWIGPGKDTGPDRCR